MRPTMRFARATALACSALALTALVALLPTRAHAAPPIGNIDHFSSGFVVGWGGQDSLSNPGTGGKDGAGDGYLLVSEHVNAHLGTMSDSTLYVGDWLDANIDRVRFWLNDVNADENLEIHFGIGNGLNFWQSNIGFSPPLHAWAQFTVDLKDSAQFTNTIAFGNGFDDALRNVDRINLRHDKAPFMQLPDFISGDFGLDDFETTSSLVGVGPAPGPSGLRALVLAPPYPNPAPGHVACAFDVFDDAPVHVRVIDAAGRIVHGETLAGAAPGRRTWLWNGLDDRGAAAPAGAYRVRVVGAAGGMSRPFVLLR